MRACCPFADFQGGHGDPGVMCLKGAKSYRGKGATLPWMRRLRVPVGGVGRQVGPGSDAWTTAGGVYPPIGRGGGGV